MDSPQYKRELDEATVKILNVLNLIINGQSSILQNKEVNEDVILSFKPYYKWIVLNTSRSSEPWYEIFI